MRRLIVHVGNCKDPAVCLTDQAVLSLADALRSLLPLYQRHSREVLAGDLLTLEGQGRIRVVAGSEDEWPPEILRLTHSLNMADLDVLPGTSLVFEVAP